MAITIEEKTYDDIFALAKDLSSGKESYAKALRSPEVLSFIREEDSYKGKRADALSLSSLPDDVFLFRMQEILNPFLPFAFHGKVYESYADLGRELLASSPTPSPFLLPILRYHLVSEHMKTSGYEKDHVEESRKVSEIENEDKEDSTYSYFALGYYLSGSKSFFYQGVEYADLYNFTYYLIKKETDLNALGTYLGSSSLLKAYGDYGNEKALVKEYLHLCKEVDRSEEALLSFQEKRKSSYPQRPSQEEKKKL